jgi:NADH-quinone oxidoreductase subunit A
MIATYAPMFLLLVVAFTISSIFYAAATFLGPKRKPDADVAERNAPFECGSESTGGRLKLSVKFYLTAILFVVFDIEAVFVYPWAIHFRELGWLGLFSMIGFLTVLVVGLAYVWKKGALEWET